jgi:hypothetical protein
VNFTTYVYFILLKILRKIYKIFSTINENPADEAVLKTFQANSLGEPNNFWVPAKLIALP